MATRAAARGLRLLQKRGFLDGPPATRLGVGLKARFSSTPPAAALLPAPPQCCSCERQMADLRRELLELRRETLNEHHHIWDKIDELLRVNHGLRQSMVLLEAQNIRNQMQAVEAMVKTSYRILGSCGAFVLGLFTVMTPLLKKDWQHDTLDLWEKRVRKGSAIANGQTKDLEAPVCSCGQGSPGCVIVQEEINKGVVKLKTSPSVHHGAAGAQEQCNNGVEKPKTKSPSGGAAGPKSPED